MANAILYTRTPTTRVADVADPQSLPTAQKLEFTFPDDIMEGVNETYENNIKSITSPNQDGARKINIQENGLSNSTIAINGVFKKTAGVGIAQLQILRKQKQVDTFHIFGNIGLEIDNAPEFNLDPTATTGFHIISTTVGYAGVRTTRYEFSVTLGFGGTVV